MDAALCGATDGMMPISASVAKFSLCVLDASGLRMVIVLVSVCR